MKKFLFLCMVGLLLLSTPITSHASLQLDGNDEPSGDVEEDNDNPGEDPGTEPGPDPGGGSDEPSEPTELSFSPNVTALHSVNGLLAQEGESVFFLPRLEDFPVDLTTTCADLTTADGVAHKFSVVYDGYFDNEVVYDLATPDNWDSTETQRLQTSKRIYSQYDNSRSLNILGYDLLLANEQSSIDTSGGDIVIDYYPTLVGGAPLTAKTVIMDLYKAVGQYEWDIKVCYGKDDTLAVNTSPIMQSLVVDINDYHEGGIETAEGATYVWATRTNPDIYWERARRDAIFDGGAHLYTEEFYVGNDVSVRFSKNENDTITFPEFFQLARAIMELYGEPVMTEAERDAMLQMYALDLPTQGFTSDVIEDMEYLLAKGIIEPVSRNYNRAVTFADIEPYLLRIADKSSRLTMNVVTNSDSIMTQAGFVPASLKLNPNSFNSFEEITNPFDSDYYDYFIEAVDGKTNFYLKTIAGINLEEQENMQDEDDDSSGNYVGAIPPDLPAKKTHTDYVFACDRITVQGTNSGATTSGSGYFENKGLTEINGRYYYHMQISRDIGSVTISYNYDPETEELKDVTSYSLPVAEGGVYNFSGDLPAFQTFDEAGYSDAFVDATRVSEDYYDLSSTSSYLSSWHWYVVRYDLSSYATLHDNEVFCSWTHKDAGGKDTVTKLTKLEVNSALNSGKPFVFPESDGEQCRVFCSQSKFQGKQSSTDTVVLVYQTNMDLTDFTRKVITNGANTKHTSSYNCYYKHDDGTLLVPYSYLKSSGKTQNITTVPEGEGIVITTPAANIALRTDIDAVIVGDTYIPSNGELLYYLDGDGQYYINYKVCNGWTSKPYLVTDGQNVIPCQNDALSTRLNKVNFSKRSITTYFPTCTVPLGWCTYKNESSGMKVEGVAMSGSNVLGNYMVVYNNTGSDKLFVWHRQNVVSPDGNTCSLGQDARGEFESLTGISVSSVPDDYVLLSYDLSRNNVGNPTGITYVSFDWKDAYTSGTADIGYVYTPNSAFTSIDSALNTYCKGDSSCALPVVKIYNTIVNLNMNTCSELDNEKQLPIGQLPMCLENNGNSFVNRMGQLTTNNRATSVKESSSDYEDLEVTLLAAPVGFFQQLKGLGTQSVNEISRGYGRVFFGSSECTIVDGNPTINYYQLEFTEEADVVRSYLASNIKNDIWVTSGTESSLGAYLEELALKGEVIVTEPERVVDWAAYKFHRLVQNLDDWTSVALIFVLNILPRVAILLFFALMLLSLIKNFKLWRMFCERHFDVYSFLSFGKMNVNTVDTNRIVFISLICIALFYIIMDGQLFNFIIWVCEWFIALYQR